MTRPQYEPNIYRDSAKNSSGVRNLKRKPSAMHWWAPDCVVGDDAGCTGEEPTLINGFAQAGGNLEVFAFRLNDDGLIQTKGFLDVSEATSGTVAWVMPGAVPGETDFIPPTPKNDAFSLRVTTTGDREGIVNATAHINRDTGDVTVSWLGSGLGIFEIKVFEDDVVVIVRDWKFDIPVELDNSTLVDCEAWVTAPSGSGTIVVQLRNHTAGVDMLSTPMSIDVGELNDDDSGTPFVIDDASATVSYKDEIWVRVISAGSGAMGLGAKVAFTPAATAAITLRGAKGDPGGISSFQGAWQNATQYHAGDVVTRNGVAYIALQDHISNAANDEPGVGTNWEDFWVPIVNVPMNAGWTLNVLSSSGPVPDGVKTAAIMPFDGTITEAIILADQVTDAEIDIWVSDFAGYPAGSGDSITGGTPPTLTGAIKNLDSTLSGWTTALNEGDILLFNVSGVTNARRLSLGLKVVK